MAISFFSCLCLSIRIRGQLRWGNGGIKQQTSKQTINQTNKTHIKKIKTNKQESCNLILFSTIGSGGSNTLFFCTCFPNLLYYIQSRLNRKAARVDNFHLMTEAFNKAAHPKMFWDVLRSLLPRLKFMYKTYFFAQGCVD